MQIKYFFRLAFISLAPALLQAGALPLPPTLPDDPTELKAIIERDTQEIVILRCMRLHSEQGADKLMVALAQSKQMVDELILALARSKKTVDELMSALNQKEQADQSLQSITDEISNKFICRENKLLRKNFKLFINNRLQGNAIGDLQEERSELLRNAAILSRKDLEKGNHHESSHQHHKKHHHKEKHHHKHRTPYGPSPEPLVESTCENDPRKRKYSETDSE